MLVLANSSELGLGCSARTAYHKHMSPMAALEAAAFMASFSLSVAALKWSPRVIHQPVAPNRGSSTFPTGST